MKNINTTKRTQRKAFSLVELVVVILIIAILAVAVFAGGSAAIKKSQVSRTTSDLHNFSVAIEAAVNATPTVANIYSDDILVGGEGADKNNFDATKPMGKIIAAVNANLAADYQLSTVSGTGLDGVTKGNGGAIGTASGKNLNFTDGPSYVILQSAKTDAWDNPYYVIFDLGERHAKGQSDFYITVVSAGPNSQTNVGGYIEADDIFLLVQYSDGDVSAVTYNCAEGGLKVTTAVNPATNPSYTLTAFDKTATPNTLVTKGNGGSMLYAGGENNTSYEQSHLPVNF